MKGARLIVNMWTHNWLWMCEHIRLFDKVELGTSLFSKYKVCPSSRVKLKIDQKISATRIVYSSGIYIRYFSDGIGTSLKTLKSLA
jgi:hypothetical protein